MNRIKREERYPLCARIAFVALLGLMSVGCAVNQQTKQSLAAYSTAMAEVDQTASFFLTDFEDRVEALERKAREKQAMDAGELAPEFPDKFVPPTPITEAKTEFEKALLSSRSGLTVVREYNAALVALAEGESTTQLRTRMARLGDSIQGIGTLLGVGVPAFGPFVGIGAQILKVAQDAQNKAEFREAVKKGREPVFTILETLEKQTPTFYDTSLVETNQRRDVYLKNVQRTLLTLRTVISKTGPPRDADLAAEMASYSAEILDIGKTMRIPSAALPVPWPFVSGKPAYDADTHQQIKVFMQNLRADRDGYGETVARQLAYYDLVTQYALSLQRTREALTAVESSIDAPVDLRAEVGRLLGTAFSFRDALSEFRNPFTGRPTQ